MESKVSRPLHSNTKIEQLLRDAGEHPVGGTREPIHALLENVSTTTLKHLTEPPCAETMRRRRRMELTEVFTG